MERFSKPGAAAIIEKTEAGKNYILIQQRFKENTPSEDGLLEIPAGKVREFENIYDTLRREVFEETGLRVTEIRGENSARIFEANGYKVLSYEPFSSSQNIAGSYPIMVQAFICRVEGTMLTESDESKNIRWISLDELSELLENEPGSFYPMHVETLKKYLSYAGGKK